MEVNYLRREWKGVMLLYSESILFHLNQGVQFWDGGEMEVSDKNHWPLQGPIILAIHVPALCKQTNKSGTKGEEFKPRQWEARWPMRADNVATKA